MKVIIAIDSMKGCLDSLSACRAYGRGVTERWPEASVVCVPVGDGGEGTAEALAYGNVGFRRMSSCVMNPAGEYIDAEWIIDTSSQTAFIDMASAAGLPLIEPSLRNPLHTTTYGVGEMIRDAVYCGARTILLGLGGSATVDGGLGACQALGLELIGEDGKNLPVPFTGDMLTRLKDFRITDNFITNIEIADMQLLCDVDNPLTGPLGAARVFGPQKGADPNAVECLESGLERLRSMILSKYGTDLNSYPGAGAAGGMAGGLTVLAGGKIRKGASTILDFIGFDEKVGDADMIVTGEGSADRQTLMGKLPYEILKRGRQHEIPVVLVAGKVEDEKELRAAGFADVVCINSEKIMAGSGAEGSDAMDSQTAIRRLNTAGRLIGLRQNLCDNDEDGCD